MPLASPDTTRELVVRVLCYPEFGFTEDERGDLLADYLPCCETVIVSEPPERACVPRSGKYAVPATRPGRARGRCGDR